MINFNTFRRECALRNGENCTYYSESTQCHILNCPLFAPDTPKKTKKAIKRRMVESVKFNTSDLDTTTQTSVRDLMDHARNIPPEKRSPTLARQALHAQNPVQRLICMVCRELITDDKFITIRDSTDVMLYLHSKGKCDIRHENTEKVRQEFLNRYKRYQQERTNSAAGIDEENEDGNEEGLDEAKRNK